MTKHEILSWEQKLDYLMILLEKGNFIKVYELCKVYYKQLSELEPIDKTRHESRD